MILTFLAPISAHGMFSDTREHWAEEYIFWATFDYPVFSGYPNGLFKPDESITRAEYLTSVNKLLALAKDPYEQQTNASVSYEDLKENHWAYSHIQATHQSMEGAKHNEISIYEVFSGPLLEPEKNITRYEAALISRAILSPQTGQQKIDTNKLWDLDPLDPNSLYIRELEAKGIINGFPDGSFRPKESVTRAEAAVLSNKIFKDLRHLEDNYLMPTPMMDMNVTAYPIFYRAGLDESTEKHHRFIDAVTSLEYLSIIGFIPHEERSLYDPEPIKTVWELKEDHYENKLGISYYLIKYDDSLTDQQKKSLANNAIKEYLLLSDGEVEGMSAFFKMIQNIADADLFQKGAENFLDVARDEVEMHQTMNLLAEHYRKTNQWDSAQHIYHTVIHQTDDVKILKRAIQNLAYTSLQHKSNEETIQIMKDLQDTALSQWKSSGDWESIGFLVEGIQKQLLLQ